MNAYLLRGALLAAGAILSGCSGLPALHPPPPEAPGRYLPLTTPIIAVGDTQEHEATGMPMLDNDSAVDAYVEVAQRPPEQPLFGRKIFETVLTSHPDMPLLHLGDRSSRSSKPSAATPSPSPRGFPKARARC